MSGAPVHRVPAIGGGLEQPQADDRLACPHGSASILPDEPLHTRALTAPAPGYTVVYGVSANTRGWWDLSSARALGYDPQDDAETYADTVPSRPEDEAEAAFVGGPLATEAAHRPALD